MGIHNAAEDDVTFPRIVGYPNFMGIHNEDKNDNRASKIVGYPNFMGIHNSTVPDHCNLMDCWLS